MQSLRLGRRNLHMFRMTNNRFDIIGGMLYYLLVVSAQVLAPQGKVFSSVQRVLALCRWSLVSKLFLMQSRLPGISCSYVDSSTCPHLTTLGAGTLYVSTCHIMFLVAAVHR